MSGIQTKNRAGHTLIELLIAMGSATFLMGGMASTIYIASHALDGAGSAPIQTLTAAGIDAQRHRLFAGGVSAGGLYGTIHEVFGVDFENFQFMFKARVRELQ